MSQPILDRITAQVAVIGGMLALIAFAIGGATMGLGALVGAGVALLNFIGLRWLLAPLAGHATQLSQGGAMGLLVLKLAATSALCWVLLGVLHLDPIGFAIGLSALVLGVTLGSSHLLSPQDAAHAAKEEG